MKRFPTPRVDGLRVNAKYAHATREKCSKISVRSFDSFWEYLYLSLTLSMVRRCLMEKTGCVSKKKNIAFIRSDPNSWEIRIYRKKNNPDECPPRKFGIVIRIACTNSLGTQTEGKIDLFSFVGLYFCLLVHGSSWKKSRGAYPEQINLKNNSNRSAHPQKSQPRERNLSFLTRHCLQYSIK